MGNILADVQAMEAVGRSAHGQTVAVRLPLQPMYGARPMSRSMSDMEWRIHKPRKWRPTWSLHHRMEQLLRESPKTGILLVLLHLGCSTRSRHARAVNTTKR